MVKKKKQTKQKRLRKTISGMENQKSLKKKLMTFGVERINQKTQKMISGVEKEVLKKKSNLSVN